MRLIRLILFYFLITISWFSNAQIADTVSLKPWQLIGFARRYEVMGDKQSAIFFYSKYLTFKPDIKIHLKLADLYNDVHDYRNAARIYKMYMNEPNNDGYRAKYKYAQILKIMMQYSEARDIFVRFKEKTMNPKELGINKELLANAIKGCDLAIQFKDTVVRTIVKPVAGNINKWHTEMAATYLDSQKMVFGSTRLDTLLYYDVDSVKLAPKIRFYEARKKGSSWSVNDVAKAPFNEFLDNNTGGGCFSLDKMRFYFAKGEMNWKFQIIYKLYVVHYVNGKWSSPKEVGGNTNFKGFSSSQPTLGNCYDPDLEVIYYVSNRPEGQGGTDIWYTVYNTVNKTYESSQNAGIYLNSVGDELSPFFDYSSHCLYFSSNGWYSIGGFDIFKSSGDLVNWSEPKNIGVPINSSFDDLFFNLLPNSNKGLVTSNRNDISERKINNYFDDIFEFEESNSERVWVTGVLFSDEAVNEANVFKTTKNEATVASEEKYKAISKKSSVIDKVTTSDSSKRIALGSKALSNAVISLRLQQDSLTSVLLTTQQTDSVGRFGFWVEKGRDLKIVVSSDSILNNEISFSTKQTNFDVEKITLAAAPLKVISDKPIPLRNLYYDFDADQVSSESQLVLDSTLILLMTKFPRISIEINSHTDNIGTDDYNNSLSLRRANNVKKYLISKGIDESRLVAKGYGKLKPIVANVLEDGSDNPEGRKMNRRTEFLILRQFK